MGEKKDELRKEKKKPTIARTKKRSGLVFVCIALDSTEKSVPSFFWGLAGILYLGDN